MLTLFAAILATFWQLIKPVDVAILRWINQDGGNAFFDAFLPYLRETYFWIPLYFFLILFVTANFGKRAWWWILAGVLTAALSDLISSQLIKENIMRLRPCQDPEIAYQIRFFINYCPQSSSFTSSHATSHFAQAMFFFITLKPFTKWSSLFFVWAFVIAYTQVYVGVHYPFDVACGALLGCLIGFTTAKMFHKQIGMLSLDKQIG